VGLSLYVFFIFSFGCMHNDTPLAMFYANQVGFDPPSLVPAFLFDTSLICRKNSGGLIELFLSGGTLIGVTN
jgi:hypothetical protein